jgi:hypothetical protein
MESLAFHPPTGAGNERDVALDFAIIGRRIGMTLLAIL